MKLDEFEPDVFNKFVEFMYFGRYTYKDDLNDSTRVREGAKTWVLGDYLDAVEFKNFSIRNLYEIYMPSTPASVKAGIGPEMVGYCCSKTVSGSPLYRLVSRVLARYWHQDHVIRYQSWDRELWEEVWEKYADLRNDVLFFTQGTTLVDDCGVSDYLEGLAIADEAVPAEASVSEPQNETAPSGARISMDQLRSMASDSVHNPSNYVHRHVCWRSTGPQVFKCESVHYAILADR